MKRVFLLIIISVFFFGCGPQKMEPISDAPVQEISAPVPVQEQAPAMEISTETEGLVVYLSGDVSVNRGGEESFLDIGDSVMQSDLIETGDDGYCEIQLGEIAVVRMESNSILQLQALMTSDKGSRMAVDLKNGTVLCKVKKLLEEDSFQVKTNTVVCGVRGTQFSVSSDETIQDTLLAVKEGAVAVMPRSLDKVSELAVNEVTLVPIAAQIQKTSLVVGASEELAVKSDTFKETAELSKIVEAVLQKVEEKQKAQTALLNDGGDAEKENLAVLEADMQKEVDKLLVTLEKTPESIAPKLMEVQELSAKSQETLKSTDRMEIMALPVAAAGVDDVVLPALFKIQVLVTPSNALILQKGNVLGTGSFSKLYTDGTELKMEISLDGYKTQTLEMIVNEESSGKYSLTLEEIPAEPVEPVAVEPPTPVLTTAPVVETPIVAKAPVYSVEVRIEPADAAFSVNGNKGTGGRWSSEETEGAVLKVEASRNGFESASQQISVNATTGSVVIKLKPKPLEATASLGMGSPVGVLVEKGGMYLAADANGKLAAFNRSGKVLWQYKSANTPNANSSPVEHNGNVYFSGGTELVVLKSGTGAVVNTISLPEERSHIYGRRVVPFGDQLMMPTNDYIVLIDSSGKDVGSLPIGGGSSMSPALWSGKPVVADKKGSLLILDPSNGTVLSSVPTSAIQSVAQSPSIYEDKAVFSSRKGIVAAVNLKSGTVLWERELDRTIFADVLVTKEGCFLYTTKKEVFALSWKSGENLFAPLSNVTSMPGYDKGRLVFTEGSGTLKVMNAGNGSILKQYNLKDSFTAKPIVRDGIIVGVGKSGQFYRINTEGIVD
ncbi:PQQ-binding-like beta-propeller repeat protein [Oceanispirochaeta sp.]|jgi:outer membrane protein assembly factor BamB|uniref:outer membrane protein assembly factor BamB family protein n=1 Tax=Oceanispirochaeta sp. TaxID=2035350 RepID=UPI002638110F|nr:PQQ-binding-like beta-propeller repeat protein [Oceanispirochaeta sp.]MDA3958919.1 PQQ-binding-like beta-propeller repeat protein [Oceanispirochaeta sp.]